MATLPFFLLLTVSALLPASHGSGDIAIYWGQDSREGTLADACATGLYSYAIIAFLNVFGAGRTPSLNLAGHCYPSSPGSCSAIGAHVKTCQSTNVKVFLALGGAIGNYSLSSSADAQGVADYLWNNFLGGSSSSRPFGAAAVLDGIDLAIVVGRPDHYDELARHLNRHFSRSKSTYYLSAAPQCPYPDKLLAAALDTGLFRTRTSSLRRLSTPGCFGSHGCSSTTTRRASTRRATPAASRGRGRRGRARTPPSAPCTWGSRRPPRPPATGTSRPPISSTR